MTWIRLNMIVEGQTEEKFVNEVIKEHLASFNIGVSVRCVETGRDKKNGKIYRGGLLNYEKAKNDLLRWIKEDAKSDARFTTMFDYYALAKNFPGFKENPNQDVYQRIAELESAFGGDIPDRRFVPYIQLHEFETLLFVDPAILKDYFDDKDKTDRIQRLCQLVAQQKEGNPEFIDDGEETAPSKRIIQEFELYESNKVNAGAEAAKAIGLEQLRNRCRHFSEWIAKLERLAD